MSLQHELRIAVETAHALRQERDQLLACVRELEDREHDWEGRLDTVTRERDEARAEAKRYRDALIAAKEEFANPNERTGYDNDPVVHIVIAAIADGGEG